MDAFIDTLRETMTLEHAAALEACLRCGNCGTACAWVLETGDAELHPLRRVELLRDVYRRFLTWEGRVFGRAWAATQAREKVFEKREAFWKCTACGRCTLACPLGISQRGLFRWARNAYSASDLGPAHPIRQAIADNTRLFSHSFGVSRERVFLLLGAFFAAHEIEAPVDAPGAEYLLVFPTVDAYRFPNHLYKLFALLNAMGVRYTGSSRVVDLGTEVDHVLVDHKLSERILCAVEAEAERLGVRKLIVPECGCDVRTFFMDASRILGRPLRVAVESVDVLLRDAIAVGSLPVHPIERTVTLHDPCQVTRLSGLGQVARDILAMIASRFVEMTPNREDNYCCNGSSGPLRLVENTDLRRRVSRLKAQQIRNTGAECVVTPCAICTLSLTDICDHYGLSKGEPMVRILYDLIYEAVYPALCEAGRENACSLPAVLVGQSEEAIAQYSLSGVCAHLEESGDIEAHWRWVSEQPPVQRSGIVLRRPGERSEKPIRRAEAK